MKKIIHQLTALSLAILLLSSCEAKMEKPFIITEKDYSNRHPGVCWYMYQDKNGTTKTFIDTDKYNVGDTLK